MYPTVLDKIATHTVVSSQVLDNVIRTIEHATIDKMTTNWAKNTTRDLAQLCPKNFQDLRS